MSKSEIALIKKLYQKVSDLEKEIKELREEIRRDKTPIWFPKDPQPTYPHQIGPYYTDPSPKNPNFNGPWMVTSRREG